MRAVHTEAAIGPSDRGQPRCTSTNQTLRQDSVGAEASRDDVPLGLIGREHVDHEHTAGARPAQRDPGASELVGVPSGACNLTTSFDLNAMPYSPSDAQQSSAWRVLPWRSIRWSSSTSTAASTNGNPLPGCSDCFPKDPRSAVAATTAQREQEFRRSAMTLVIEFGSQTNCDSVGGAAVRKLKRFWRGGASFANMVQCGGGESAAAETFDAT